MNAWDKLLTLRSSLTIPMTHVMGVEINPAIADPANCAKAMKIAGSYWPHKFATGYFAVEGESNVEAHAKLSQAIAAK